MPNLSPERIRQLLADIDKPAEPALARRLHDQIGACAGLDAAIAAAGVDHAFTDLAALLALRDALLEARNPALTAARLRGEAQALDAKAEKLMAEASELFGRGAHRSTRGETALAEDYFARARALEAGGAEAGEAASQHRQAAAVIEGALARAAALAGVAA